MVSVYMTLVKHVYRIASGLIISFFAAFLFNSVQSREAQIQKTWRERESERARERESESDGMQQRSLSDFELRGVAVYTALVSAPRPS